jgi:hypothetical protein
LIGIPSIIGDQSLPNAHGQTNYEEIAGLEEDEHELDAEAETAIAAIEADFEGAGAEAEAETEAEFEGGEQDEDLADSAGLKDEAILAAEGELGALNGENPSQKATMGDGQGPRSVMSTQFHIEFRKGLPHSSEDQIQLRRAALKPYYQLENEITAEDEAEILSAARPVARIQYETGMLYSGQLYVESC